MTDIFRSAFSYISSGIGASGDTERGSELVGDVVELGELKLKVKKVIAEGGYGFVYAATDTVTGKDYAIKRQLVPVDQVKIVKQEVSFLKQLRGHPNIIEFVGALGTPPTQGAAELIIVTELVTGGNMADIVNYQRLSPRQVLRVFHETCLAVAHMHSRKPAIIHRDLKVENLLLTKSKRIKLCDFGSATTHQVLPDHSWSATQRGLAEDEIQRNTTPMYRSPEMIDLYSNNPVNEKSDIWALGCLLFKLCYQEHPFEDSAKLRILNANYHIPSNDVAYTLFHNIIRSCLVVEPQKRPSADALVAQLFSIADKLGENLDGPHKEPLEFVLPDHQGTRSETSDHSQHESIMGSTLQNTSQQAHKLFGMMRGGAENLFKNIKDTSNKVITTVQGGSRSRPLDISYITSRILVMSFPYEEPSQPFQNTIVDVGVYLEETHPSQYLIFNLSGEQYDVSKLNGQVVDYEWPFKVVPPLESLVELCRQMDSWLKADPQNVLVIHCKDGVYPSIVLACTYLLFLKALPSPQATIRMFMSKRLQEGRGLQLSASDRRYLKYMTELVAIPKPFKPHSRSLYILMMRLSSVPLYNEAKDGCKPFIEIYIDGERVFTSCSKDNMTSIRSFTSKDGVVEIPVGVSVCGNLHVVVHHIKSVPGPASQQARSGMGMSAVKMFHMQFHSGFVPLDASSLSFNRNELDGPAAKRHERFPDPFQVSFDLQVESTQQNHGDIAWQQLPHPQTHPITCFSTAQEQEEVFELFSRQTKQHRGVGGGASTKTTPVSPEGGYSQMKNDDKVAVADLLGGDQGSAPVPNDNVLYSSYRDEPHDDSASTSSSSSSSESSSGDSSEAELPGGNQFDPFSKYKPVNGSSRQSSNGESAGTRGNDDFFSNPSAGGEGGLEEANLLEFSVEEGNEDPPLVPNQQHSSKQYDPFAMWESEPTAHPPSSSTVPPTITMQSSSSSVTAKDDPFSMWGDEPSNAPPPTSSATPSNMGSNILTPSSPTAPPPSDSNFDPFGIWDQSNKDSEKTPIVEEPELVSDDLEFDPFAPSSSFSANSRQTSTTSIGSTHSAQGSLSGSQSFNNTSMPTKPHGSFGDIWGSSSGIPTQPQQPQQQQRQQSQKPYDPFASFGNFGTSGNNGGKQQQPMGNPSPTHQSTMTSRPMYQMGSGMGYGSSGGLHVPSSGGGSSSRPSSRPGSRPGSRPPSGGGGAGGGRPRSVSPNETSNGTGINPNKPRGAQFDDLLDQNLFANKKKQQSGPTPLKQLQAKKKIDTITDPDRAKVAEWADGKEHNIRALLSSLHTILWEGEKRWKPVGMHQLVDGDQVGKFFRKACLSVHPDKAQGKAHENLARAIFDELNDAYELFEASGSKSLY